MWLGVTTSLKTLYHGNGYWCHRSSLTYYGGRESKLHRLSSREGLPDLNAQIAADSAYGSIQSGSRNYVSPNWDQNPCVHYKLQPYTSGDTVEVIVDARNRLMIVSVNGEFQVSHKVPEDQEWSEYLYPFVVLDETLDEVELYASIEESLTD